MSESSSICLVMPYFGQWPFWMPFFLQSCRFNPSVDWLLYTDCQPLDHCPENVRVVQISLNDYCRKVSTKLSIDFSPTKAYKLCDIRPNAPNLARHCHNSISKQRNGLRAWKAPGRIRIPLIRM